MSKLVVITGATGGIGSYIAGQAMEAGYEVLGLSRKPGDNQHFQVLQCDITQPGEVTEVFRSLRKADLWALVNAAGAAAMNLHLTTPVSTMQRIIACNLLGTMYCSAEAGKILVRRKTGRIINFSTIAVALGLAGESSYVAAKAGVEGFTRAFGREMGIFGITVNAIAPGPVPTRLLAGVPEAKIENLRQRQILQRPIEREDIWNVTSWLLSENSASISGEIFHVGGA